MVGFLWDQMPTLGDAIARYDDEHSFARLITLPEEERARYTSAKWAGGYRWFRSPNVICLEKARRVRLAANARSPSLRRP